MHTETDAIHLINDNKYKTQVCASNDTQILALYLPALQPQVRHIITRKNKLQTSNHRQNESHTQFKIRIFFQTIKCEIERKKQIRQLQFVPLKLRSN